MPLDTTTQVTLLPTNNDSGNVVETVMAPTAHNTNQPSNNNVEEAASSTVVESTAVAAAASSVAPLLSCYLHSPSNILSEAPSMMESTSEVSDNGCNPLMAVYAISMTLPIHQAYLRSAGSVGDAIFEEVVQQGLWSKAYMELGSKDGSVVNVPVNITGGSHPPFDHGDVLVITPHALDELHDARIMRTKVQAVRLHGFEKATSIPLNFLSECTSLVSMDLSPLSNVTKIQGDLLSYCTSLASIDLSPLSNVTKIRRFFLWRCTSLVDVDLSPVRHALQ